MAGRVDCPMAGLVTWWLGHPVGRYAYKYIAVFIPNATLFLFGRRFISIYLVPLLDRSDAIATVSSLSSYNMCWRWWLWWDCGFCFCLLWSVGCAISCCRGGLLFSGGGVCLLVSWRSLDREPGCDWFMSTLMGVSVPWWCPCPGAAFVWSPVGLRPWCPYLGLWWLLLELWWSLLGLWWSDLLGVLFHLWWLRLVCGDGVLWGLILFLVGEVLLLRLEEDCPILVALRSGVLSSVVQLCLRWRDLGFLFWRSLSASVLFWLLVLLLPLFGLMVIFLIGVGSSSSEVEEGSVSILMCAGPGWCRKLQLEPLLHFPSEKPAQYCGFVLSWWWGVCVHCHILLFLVSLCHFSGYVTDYLLHFVSVVGRSCNLEYAVVVISSSSVNLYSI